MIHKRHTKVCTEGWFYLIVLGFVIGGALMREINLLMVIAGMMLGPLLYNWREVITSLGCLEIRRKLPEGICAGDLLVVDLVLSNHSPRYGSAAVVVDDLVHRDHLRRPGDRTSASVLFSEIAAGQSKHQRYQGRLTQRGKYRFGPLKMSTRFPLGLIRRTITVGDIQTMTVCPRLGYLTPAWSSLHQNSIRGSRPTPRQQSSSEADFFGLRDWQSGDSLSSIHWRTSARRGNLVVRQSEQQRQQDLLLLVDLWQPSSPSPEDLENVELAVSFAATVVADLCRRGGNQLDVGLAGSKVKLSRGFASVARLNEIMEELAVLEPYVGDRLPELFRDSRKKIRTGTTVLVVSTRQVDADEAQKASALAGIPTGELSGERVLFIHARRDALGRYFCLD